MKYLLFLFFAVLLVSCAVTKHRPAFQDEQLAMRYFLDSIYPKDTSYEGKELLFDYRVRDRTGLSWDDRVWTDEIFIRTMHTLVMLDFDGKSHAVKTYYKKKAYPVNRWKADIGLRKKYISYDSAFRSVFDSKTKAAVDSKNALITVGAYFYDAYELIPIPEKDTFYKQKLDSSYTVVGIGLSYKEGGETKENLYIFNCVNQKFTVIYKLLDWHRHYDPSYDILDQRSTILWDNGYPLFYNQED